MCRAAIRWAGSASSGISTSGPASSLRNRTAPDPAHRTGSSTPAIRSASSCGGQTSGPQSRPPCPANAAAKTSPRRASSTGRRTDPSRPVEPASERVEGPDPADVDAPAQPQCPCRRDPDPQAGERARADADSDGADLTPAARGLRRPLDLGEQRRRVQRAALLGEPEQRLVEDLVPPHRCDGGVLGRGVEADRRQRAGYGLTLKTNSPTFLPCTNQVTLCFPGMFEVILLT